MKAALCFIINYKHILNKEEIWKKWIEPNKDIINVYFFYKDRSLIQSEWILEHCIPDSFIRNTSYYDVIPAYISLMNYGFQTDANNQWFCFLTDSCCPIISPRRFRYLFFTYYHKSVMSWRKAWWNPAFHKRANLAMFPQELRLANDPWFVWNRDHVEICLKYVKIKQPIVKMICNGGLANESLFAMILYSTKQMGSVMNQVTHAADWSRMMSSTSPYLFSQKCDQDMEFIKKTLNANRCIMFIRKVDPQFSDDVLKYFIYEYSKDSDSKLRIPFFHSYVMNTMCKMFKLFFFLYLAYLCFSMYFLKMFVSIQRIIFI